MTNGQEGLSIYRVDSVDSYIRIGGNSFGATTLWSLLTLTCGYEDPDLAVSEAENGNNQLIDLSVGDIYGGNYDKFGLPTELIAASFGKLKYVDDVKKVEKKNIARSLVTLYAANFSQISALLSVDQKLDKLFILDNPFNNLKLDQMIQTCTEMFSQDKVHSIQNIYSEYFEIIGLCIDLDRKGKITVEDVEEYSGFL